MILSIGILESLPYHQLASNGVVVAIVVHGSWTVELVFQFPTVTVEIEDYWRWMIVVWESGIILWESRSASCIDLGVATPVEAMVVVVRKDDICCCRGGVAIAL